MKVPSICNFNFKGFAVSVIDCEGIVWFKAQDVCGVIDLSNVSMALKALDSDERSKFNLGRQGETNFISESGLYHLLNGSRKPQAKPFQRWVNHEVLPSIRKNGAYMTPETLEKTLTDPDFLIKLATQLKTEQEARREAETQVTIMQPKARFADAVEASKNSILIGELAKLLRQNGVDIGQNRLFKWLRSHSYLCKRGEFSNMPTQKAMDLKLFEIKKRAIDNPDGSVRMTRTTKVTGKGQVYFINKFLEEQEVS
jgi:anti-repressor protein